ncbi:MAG TPA: hypothetical protein VKX17_15420 [Planctomycetota bacterium]|nr:hypothetical protein [Planctomycetota bacterium]
MNKKPAALIALSLAVLACIVEISLTERLSFSRVPHGKSARAAIAIRDNVSAFEKWGSKQFTEPYLNRYYDAAWYFTQCDSDKCEREFSATIDRALERYPQVDLFILAHTNSFLTWMKKLSPERRAHLRLVYNTGCYNLPQGAEWLKLGAKACVGHPGESDSPFFYFYFLRRWTRGEPLQSALDESNALMQTTVRRAEFFSFGKVNAAKIIKNTEASLQGDGQLRIATENEGSLAREHHDDGAR